jgi:hypothetical protein
MRLRLVILSQNGISCTYGHSQLKTGHPVRSAIHKQLNGRLVLRWVTTWESLLLYVLYFFCSLSSLNHLFFFSTLGYREQIDALFQSFQSNGGFQNLELLQPIWGLRRSKKYVDTQDVEQEN